MQGWGRGGDHALSGITAGSGLLQDERRRELVDSCGDAFEAGAVLSLAGTPPATGTAAQLLPWSRAPRWGGYRNPSRCRNPEGV